MICRQKQRESEWRSRKGGKNTTEEAIWNGKERDGCSLHIIEGVSRHNRSAWWSDRAGNFFSDGWLHVYILMGSIDRVGKEKEIYKIYTYRDCANTSSIFSFCHVGKKGHGSVWIPGFDSSSCWVVFVVAVLHSEAPSSFLFSCGAVI